MRRAFDRRRRRGYDAMICGCLRKRPLPVTCQLSPSWMAGASYKCERIEILKMTLFYSCAVIFIFVNSEVVIPRHGSSLMRYLIMHPFHVLIKSSKEVNLPASIVGFGENHNTFSNDFRQERVFYD